MAADSKRIDGAAIAAERIAREAVERTGSLDLGRLGLKALWKGLFVIIAHMHSDSS